MLNLPIIERLAKLFPGARSKIEGIIGCVDHGRAEFREDIAVEIVSLSKHLLIATRVDALPDHVGIDVSQFFLIGVAIFLTRIKAPAFEEVLNMFEDDHFRPYR